jgi:hypothetical protein
VRLEASTKPHAHKKIHEFLINMAFIMACPNFKKGLKMTFGPLGINEGYGSPLFFRSKKKFTNQKNKHRIINKA